MGTFQNRKKQPLTLLRADLLPYGPHMAQQGLLNRINKVPKLKECNLKTKQIKNRVLCCSFTLHLQLQNVTAFKFSKIYTGLHMDSITLLFVTYSNTQ